MQQFHIEIRDRSNNIKASSERGATTCLSYNAAYEEGDCICLEIDNSSEPGCFCHLQLDDAMLPAFVYLTNKTIRYTIPFGEKRFALSPKAFSGDRHLLFARIADEAEATTRRNLALNPYDGCSGPGLFPHAEANVETRDEAVFAARNAIDGIFANNSHGRFPYGSWGINRRDDAEWKLIFGIPVILDEVRLTLRADFPHDNYWVRASVEFSDGTTETLNLTKTAQPQRFSITPRAVEWLKLKELIKSQEESPFPALTQLEAWGYYKP
jgi:hypothetical protein